MENLKKERSNAKRAFTRQINIVKQKLVECDWETIVLQKDDMVNDVKTAFQAFADAHEKYHVKLTDEQLDESDEYFEKEQCQ